MPLFIYFSDGGPIVAQDCIMAGLFLKTLALKVYAFLSSTFSIRLCLPFKVRAQFPYPEAYTLSGQK